MLRRKLPLATLPEGIDFEVAAAQAEKNVPWVLKKLRESSDKYKEGKEQLDVKDKEQLDVKDKEQLDVKDEEQLDVKDKEQLDVKDKEQLDDPKKQTLKSELHSLADDSPTSKLKETIAKLETTQDEKKKNLRSSSSILTDKNDTITLTADEDGEITKELKCKKQIKKEPDELISHIAKMTGRIPIEMPQKTETKKTNILRESIVDDIFVDISQESSAGNLQKSSHLNKSELEIKIEKMMAEKVQNGHNEDQTIPQRKCLVQDDILSVAGLGDDIDNTEPGNRYLNKPQEPNLHYSLPKVKNYQEVRTTEDGNQTDEGHVDKKDVKIPLKLEMEEGKF